MKSYFTLLLAIFLANCVYHIAQGGRPNTIEDDILMEEQLKILNKPAIMSIQDESGALFDCINIYKQPALDHPLLKNHKIQMRPTEFLKGNRGEASEKREHSRAIPAMVNCPKGSVPVQRTQKKDLIRAQYVMEPKSSFLRPSSMENLTQHMAVFRSGIYNDSRFHGAKAALNTLNPKVDDDQISMALIWVVSGVELIATGWAVAPQLYGDHNTHFISYWRGGKPGCFNLLCSGFVQVDHSLPLDAKILNTSQYGGPQDELAISIHQDKTTKNWWLTYPYSSENVGYWPGSLFQSLKEGANTIQFGGLARGPTNKATPAMGWGTFPDLNYTTSGYFAEMQILNIDYQWAGLLDAWSEYSDAPKCYGVKFLGNGKINGYNIQYGGPSGECRN